MPRYRPSVMIVKRSRVTQCRCRCEQSAQVRDVRQRCDQQRVESFVFQQPAKPGVARQAKVRGRDLHQDAACWLRSMTIAASQPSSSAIARHAAGPRRRSAPRRRVAPRFREGDAREAQTDRVVRRAPPCRARFGRGRPLRSGLAGFVRRRRRVVEQRSKSNSPRSTSALFRCRWRRHRALNGLDGEPDRDRDARVRARSCKRQALAAPDAHEPPPWRGSPRDYPAPRRARWPVRARFVQASELAEGAAQRHLAERYPG